MVHFKGDFEVILCPCLKLACNSKPTGRRAETELNLVAVGY